MPPPYPGLNTGAPGYPVQPNAYAYPGMNGGAPGYPAQQNGYSKLTHLIILGRIFLLKLFPPIFQMPKLLKLLHHPSAQLITIQTHNTHMFLRHT